MSMVVLGCLGAECYVAIIVVIALACFDCYYLSSGGRILCMCYYFY